MDDIQFNRAFILILLVSAFVLYMDLTIWMP